MTNLHNNNSEMGKYANNSNTLTQNTPYVSNHINMAQIARDSGGFKSHEVRTKNLYNKDPKNNHRTSGESLKFFNNKSNTSKKTI